MKTLSLILLSFLLLSLNLTSQKWGYVTMIAPSGSNSIILMDTNSRVVKTISGLTGMTGYSSHMMPGGFIWRTVITNNMTFRGGGIHGRVQKIDYNGKLLFDYTISSTTQCAHHDICPLPNGNVLVIVYELKTGAEVTAKGGPNSNRYTEKLIELKPTGLNTADIVWEWHLWDHLCQTTNPSLSNYVSSVLENTHMLNINYLNTKTDWVHMNGVDYNEELDQIALSSHFLNEIWIIDHSQNKEDVKKNTGGKYGVGGGFLYRWGNPAAYGANAPAVLKVVHDAHWVPKGRPREGFMGCINNQGVSNSQTAADYFKPSWDGKQYSRTQGQSFTPTNYDFRHAANGYTSNMGSTQELPNGNLLICLATASRIYEVDSTGKQLWNYQGMAPIPQAFRYSKCYIENPEITITASLVLLKAGEETQLSSSVNSTGGTGFTYAWSPSAGLSDPSIANPVAKPDQSTVYTLTVTSSEGCTASASISIQVKSGNALNLEISADDDSICLGQIIQLHAELSGGSGNYTYEWTSSPAGFESDQKDPFINPEMNTWYYLTASDGTEEISDSILITVLALPEKPSIERIDSLLKSSASTGNQWFFYGNPIAGAIDSTYLPTETGSYQVQVIDSNGCASFLSDPYEFIISGTFERFAEFAWSIVPNPANESVRILVDPAFPLESVQLFDALGHRMYMSFTTTDISLKELPEGTYILMLTGTANQISYKKLIVVH